MEPAGPVWTLEVLEGRYAIVRLPADAGLPSWATSASEPAGGRAEGTDRSIFSITRTSDELSLVMAEGLVPEQLSAERRWRVMRVVGTLDFGLTGVLAGLLVPLAEAGVSVFAVSTFDTDYILVRECALPAARRALTGDGHEVLG